MTAKEYLQQAYCLDKRINSDLKEAAALRELAVCASSPQLKERVQTTKKGEAPFVNYVERILEMEEKINSEIDLLLDLKEEIRSVISTVKDAEEQMVLRQRYIFSHTWEQIADELGVDSRTVRRRHEAALDHVILPKKLITI